MRLTYFLKGFPQQDKKSRVKRGILLLLSVFFFISCTGRPVVKNETVNLRSVQNDRLGFQFFVFIKSGEENYRANGDAFLIKNEEFKFRIYDNLLNQHIFDYISRNSGENEVILPSDKEIYVSDNVNISNFLLNAFSDLFFNENTNNITNKNTIIFLENNKIRFIMFNADEIDIKVEVIKRITNTGQDAYGMPSRIKLERGEDNITFDIVSFSNLDFIIITNGYKVYNVPGESIFNWAGVLHGKG